MKNISLKFFLSTLIFFKVLISCDETKSSTPETKIETQTISVEKNQLSKSKEADEKEVLKPSKKKVVSVNKVKKQTKPVVTNEQFKIKTSKIIVKPSNVEGESMPLSSAEFSPDGKYLTYTYEGNKGIFVVNNDTGVKKELVSDLDAGYGFKWSADSKYILYRGASFGKNNNREEVIAIVNVDNGKKEILVDNKKRENLAYWFFNEDYQHVMYVNDNGDLKIIKSLPYKDEFKYKVDTNPKGVVTTADNTFVYEGDKQIFSSSEVMLQATISPDYSKMSYTDMPGMLHVYDFKTKQNVVIGKGIRAKWSNDSKFITYQVTEDDGDIYTGSEIYIASSDGKTVKQITHTPEIFEWSPSWSPDNKSIIFNDYKTGEIYSIVFSDK